MSALGEALAAHDSDRAGLFIISDERDAQLALRHAYWAEGYRLGYEDGRRAGYESAHRDLATAERIGHGLASTPAHAELERRRWGPGGREHFADPRPGDRHPGRETTL